MRWITRTGPPEGFTSREKVALALGTAWWLIVWSWVFKTALNALLTHFGHH